MVAIKIIECTSKTAKAVDKNIARCQDLTALAQKWDDGRRLVRLKEIIAPREASSSSSTFDDVALVLESMTPQTLADLVENRSMGTERGSMGMTMEAAAIFREAQLGVKLLYTNNWIHRDIKPQNIGVLPKRPPEAVLLDVGQAKVLITGSTLPVTPGCGGMVGYLAPEREMTKYDHGADIWGFGIFGFELIYGYHPFKFKASPLRPGEDYEQMRPAFQQRYREAIDKLSADYSRYCSQKAANRNPYFVHLGDLLVQMLKHPWEPGNCAPRINIDEALRHPAWSPLLSDCDDAQVKRIRFDGGARR